MDRFRPSMNAVALRGFQRNSARLRSNLAARQSCFWALWLCLTLVWTTGGEPTAFPEFTAATARDYLHGIAQAVEARDGEQADICFSLARLKSQMGEKEEAERLARHALEREPRRAEIQAFLAEILILQDRMEEAAQLLRQALAQKPDLPGGCRRLGMVLDRLGHRVEARTNFEAAVQFAPDDATARLVLGRWLLDQGQVKEALTQLSKAGELDPRLSGAFYALSQAQNRLGDRAAAQVSLRTFQQLKQKEKADLDARNTGYDDERFMRGLAADFHTDVAGFLLRHKQPDLAEAHLRQAIRLAPQLAAGSEMLAMLLLKTGRLTEARGVFETLVQLQPKQAGYRANLGTLLLQLKLDTAAVENLKQALELDPKQPQALNNLARYYLGARQNPLEALNLARRLVELQPTAANYDLLGWASYANGLTNEARTAAAQAVTLEPSNSAYQERYRRISQAAAPAH